MVLKYINEVRLTKKVIYRENIVKGIGFPGFLNHDLGKHRLDLYGGLEREQTLPSLDP